MQGNRVGHLKDAPKQLQPEPAGTGVRYFEDAREFWRRYRKNRFAVGGLVTMVLLTLIAIFAPVIAPRDPYAMSDFNLAAPGTPGAVLGTDILGRDLLSMLIYGTRVSLIVGFTSAIMGLIIGTLVGSLAGYFGGYTDAFLMRLTELFQILPRFFLAVVMVALFGQSLLNIIIVIGVLSWPRIARMVRGQFLSLRNQDFVDAATVVGVGHFRIVFRHILPNALPAVIVLVSLDIAQAIILEAGLSFFGLGDPTVFSWGQLLNEAQRFLRQAWWLSVLPGMAIFLAVLAFNLVGDGLNDAMNPRLKNR